MWRAGVSLASWFLMRDGFGDDARFADGLYSRLPGAAGEPRLRHGRSSRSRLSASRSWPSAATAGTC